MFPTPLKIKREGKKETNLPSGNVGFIRVFTLKCSHFENVPFEFYPVLIVHRTCSNVHEKFQLFVEHWIDGATLKTWRQKDNVTIICHLDVNIQLYDKKYFNLEYFFNANDGRDYHETSSLIENANHHYNGNNFMDSKGCLNIYPEHRRGGVNIEFY